MKLEKESLLTSLVALFFTPLGGTRCCCMWHFFLNKRFGEQWLIAVVEKIETIFWISGMI